MTPHSQPPADLARWSLHCFCLRAKSTPHRIIHLDNNGQLLFEAVKATTAEKLRENGIPVNESQLVLLETYGLIDREANRVRTRIPVLGPKAISAIRLAAASAARETLSDVSAAAGDITELLTSRELRASAHAVVFGHALDGVLWSLLAARGTLPDIELTIDEPFWRGAFWAVYPGRDGSAGTNEVTEGNTSMVMVWDDVSVESLRAVQAHPMIRTLLQTLDPGAVSLAMTPILDEDTAVPIVADDDDVHSISTALATYVAEAIPGGVECQALFAEAEVEATAEEATVIVAHEMIWEITTLLAKRNVIEPPTGSGVGERLFFRINPQAP